MPNPVPSIEDTIRDAWNMTAAHEQWIVEVGADHVIVTDERDRSFHRVSVSVGDVVEFGTPAPVRPGYLDMAEPVAASVVYASREESRPALDAPPGPDQPPPAFADVADVPDDATTAPANMPPAAVADVNPTPDPTPAQADMPPPAVADTDLPAAEPETNTIPETEEDPVSDLSEFRSRLGLADDATEQDILSALDALRTKADTAPDPATVAASAAEADDLRKEVQVLASRMQEVTGELAQAKQEKAATVKASVFDTAVKQGKIAPAERAQWESDYDEAPAAVTRVLASIAAGTAVPVAAAGYTGDNDTTTGEQVPDDIAGLFSTPFSSKEA